MFPSEVASLRHEVQQDSEKVDILTGVIVISIFDSVAISSNSHLRKDSMQYCLRKD